MGSDCASRMTTVDAHMDDPFDNDDKLAWEKLDKNLKRAGAIQTLRRLHQLTNDIKKQERQNLIRAWVLLVFFLGIVFFIGYYITTKESQTRPISLMTGHNFELLVTSSFFTEV